MGTFGLILAALPQLLKIISYFIDVMKKTPQEERRDALAAFDKAMDKANKEGDLTELSKWLGKRL